MKSVISMKKVLAFTAAICLVSIFVSAQEHHGQGCQKHMDIPNLTAEQKTQIDEMHIPHAKDMKTYKTEIDKLEAELKLLEIADKPDPKAIDAKIDEIAVAKGNLEKEKSRFHQSVRALLTEEQKLAFDSLLLKEQGCKGEQHKCNHHEKGKSCKMDSTTVKHCPNQNKTE